jgi:hypothetical protein
MISRRTVCAPVSSASFAAAASSSRCRSVAAPGLFPERRAEDRRCRHRHLLAQRPVDCGRAASSPGGIGRIDAELDRIDGVQHLFDLGPEGCDVDAAAKIGRDIDREPRREIFAPFFGGLRPPRIDVCEAAATSRLRQPSNGDRCAGTSAGGCAHRRAWERGRVTDPPITAWSTPGPAPCNAKVVLPTPLWLRNATITGHLQSGPHRTKLLARLIATGSWHGAKRSDGLTGACIADPFGPGTAVGSAGRTVPTPGSDLAPRSAQDLRSSGA